MDPVSVATAVLSTFHIVYLTSRFIYREVLRAKGFHDGKAKMARKYRSEILRLKAFWGLLTRNIGTTTDIDSLKGHPRDILAMIGDILLEMNTTLHTYSRFARELDEDYQKFYVQRSLLATDTTRAKIELPGDLDDGIDLTAEELEAEKNVPDGLSASDAMVKPKRNGIFYIFGDNSSSSKKQEREKAVVLPSKWKELPQGVAWCFQERHLNKSLKILKEQINELYTWSPYLVTSLDQSSTIDLKVVTGRAFKDFKGHMLLQQKAKDYVNGEKVTGVTLIPWKTMKGYIDDSEQPSSKILVERKETGNFPRNSTEQLAVKERQEEKEYAPQLASLLVSSNQDFEGFALGTLPFKGFSKDETVPNGCFSFAFDYPEGALGHKPLSLQQLICSKQSKYKLSLNDRFYVARMVSRCLSTLHSDGWLHKNIRSHAVKFFFHMADKAVVLQKSAPYLTDFGFSRPLDVYSAAKYPANTARNLDADVYRHPDRFGEPSQYFTKIHDVYSLGVVLLEVGMWKTARQMYDEVFQSAKGNPTGENVKEAFIKRAKQELEHRMGSAYRDAVLLCLDGEQLVKHVRTSSFAVEFQKNVVRRVDVALLNPVRTGFDDEAEPPRYEDIVS